MYLLWQRLYLANNRVMFVSDLFNTVNFWCLSGLFAGN